MRLTIFESWNHVYNPIIRTNDKYANLAIEFAVHTIQTFKIQRK